MKQFLKTSTFLRVLVLSLSFKTNDPTQALSFENDKLEVNFTRHLQFNDLVKLKLDLANRGISIDYVMLEFDEYKGLEAIKFTVDCNDGFSGGGKNLMVTNDSKYGFFRDYNENAETPFGTGKLK